MKHSLLFLLSLTAFVVLPGCSKDSDGPATKTKTELLAESSWKFDKAVADAPYGDVSAYIEACYKDNILTFLANNTGTLDEGATECSPSSAGTFEWSFQSNETILRILATIFPGSTSDFNLVSLTATQLVISQNVTLPPPVSVSTNVTFTLKH